MKKKYLCEWVVIDKPDSLFHKKSGVVMDDSFFYNGKICCRVMLGKSVETFDFEDLRIIQV